MTDYIVPLLLLIASVLALRRKENALLECVGLTKKELYKMLTTEGFLSVSELAEGQIAEAEAGAKRGDYRVIIWTNALGYAVKNNLKNFPEKCPYEEVIRGIGAAHPEYWYVE